MRTKRMDNGYLGSLLCKLNRLTAIVALMTVAGQGIAVAKRITGNVESNQQSLVEVRMMLEKVTLMETRLEELKRLEPVLKAEVRVVTKLAAKAQTGKERRIATQKIRDAENNAIAVIKELRSLRKQLDSHRLEVSLAQHEAGLSSPFGLGGEFEKSLVATPRKRDLLNEKMPETLFGKQEINQTKLDGKNKETKLARLNKDLDDLNKSLGRGNREEMLLEARDSPPIKKSPMSLEEELNDLEKELIARRGGTSQKQMKNRDTWESNKGKDDDRIVIASKLRKERPPNIRKMTKLKGETRKKLDVLNIHFQNALEDQQNACFYLLDTIASDTWTEQSENSAFESYEDARDKVLEIIHKIDSYEKSLVTQ